MPNSGLASVPAPVGLVDLIHFQALPSLKGINVDYKGYNEYVLYGQDWSSETLSLQDQSFYYLYTAMTWDNGAEKVVTWEGDGRGLFV